MFYFLPHVNQWCNCNSNLSSIISLPTNSTMTNSEHTGNTFLGHVQQPPCSLQIHLRRIPQKGKHLKKKKKKSLCSFRFCSFFCSIVRSPSSPTSTGKVLGSNSSYSPIKVLFTMDPTTFIDYPRVEREAKALNQSCLTLPSQNLPFFPPIKSLFIF